MSPRGLVVKVSLVLNALLMMFLCYYFESGQTVVPQLAEVRDFSAAETEGLLDKGSLVRLESETKETPSDSLELKMYPDLRECSNSPRLPNKYTRGDYWILERYIPATSSFRCNESVTYTTHGDYTFLDNLKPLAARWQGPISIAVYAPGEDFGVTINTILYLRECWEENIKETVTFHLYFPTSHTPKQVPASEDLLSRKIDCTSEPPPRFTNVATYRTNNKLTYPVNVGRNVARQASETYFVFPSDVELYPSINFIPEFLKMLKKPDVSNTTDPRVFVFPIFEVKQDVNPPETKKELLEMLKSRKAIPFHKYICPKCHGIPRSKDWMEQPIQPGMSVFHIAKRIRPYHVWEPIYVGTNKEPLYEERLSWEGKSDKMTQMYILCLSNYELHVLDNAFLVHKPGIKRNVRDAFRDRIMGQQNNLLSSKIRPQYRTIFGVNKNCTV